LSPRLRPILTSHAQPAPNRELDKYEPEAKNRDTGDAGSRHLLDRVPRSTQTFDRDLFHVLPILRTGYDSVKPAVDLRPPEGVLDVVDQPVVVTGAGLPLEGRGKGPVGMAWGQVSSVKVTPLAEYPRKGRGTGGVRAHRLLAGEAQLVLAWAGRSPAWAAAAGGDPVELPASYGKRDGSGVPVDKRPTAVGRPYTNG
jgi:hypothetical protein